MKFKNRKGVLSAALLMLLAAPSLLSAQVPGKEPLDHDDYAIWNSIGNTTLADNGQWIAWVTSPEEGDGILTVRSIANATPLIGEVERASGLEMTGDSRFLVFTIDPMFAVVDSLRDEGERGDDLPKDSLGVLDLSSAFASGGALNLEFFKVPEVQSWAVPADEGAFLAYLLEPADEEPDTTAAEEEAEVEEPEEPEEPTAGEEQEEEEEEKEEGDVLVLRNLTNGDETRFMDVTAYRFTDDGQWLVYAASNEDGTADGVYAVRTASGEAMTLLAGEGEYDGLALADDGDQVAFVTNRDDWEADEPGFTVYHAMLGGGEARAVATEGTAGIPDGWWVPDNASPSFSDEGTRLFFGTAPRPSDRDDQEDLRDDEKVEVDIWNWKDPLIQPMQKVQANRKREQTYQAYASTDDFQVVQLATEEIPDVTVSEGGDGSWAMGATDTYVKYGWYVSHEGTYRDIFLMNPGTGEAELVLERTSARPSFSDGGEYLAWWDGAARHHMVMDVATREIRNVTEDIPYPVHDVLDDHPDELRSYGSAGWAEDDDAYLVYDRYDIWAVDPDGVDAPRNLTEGVGREQKIEFRYLDLDREGGRFGGGGDPIDPTEEVLLSAFGEFTKQSGFYRDQFSLTREPERLVLDDVRFGYPTKADDADVVVVTRSTFQDYPNLHLTTPDFDTFEQISEANPQQDQYVWGSAELVEWISNDGTPLQGILIKPEGFDPSQKYPMMVYFYERSSDGLHSYRSPGAGTSVNPSFYVSRGYIFFIPDIPYEIGHPGESAIDAVVPGVLKIVDEGYVDKDRIGAQGHSWGGYQLAYMITRTNLFAAVEAGAPVSNMTSAYGGIRWDSGMNRQFQYEHTQSRIGGSLWEETLRYINNSPLFEADKIQTPLLMIHNDEDGAVPWYQGIEMYMAMRRLQKPVWLLNYNGEPHGLRQEPNQKDWTIRMQQFFDHYLKGAPAPVWMEEGVPAVVKGKVLGLELVGEGGE